MHYKPKSIGAQPYSSAPTVSVGNEWRHSRDLYGRSSGIAAWTGIAISCLVRSPSASRAIQTRGNNGPIRQHGRCMATRRAGAADQKSSADRYATQMRSTCAHSTDTMTLP
jgi:hypothetical protein